MRTLIARLLVVPERESNRSIGLHIRAAQNARDFHDKGGTRTVVIRRLAPAVTVHMRADDVHFAWMCGADFCAVHLLAGAGRRRLRVELAKRGVALRFRVRVHAGWNGDAAIARAA